MNWKQKLAEHYDYKCFEDMGYLDRYFAEKAVELYQKELNEKLKNVGLSISDLDEEKEEPNESFAETWKRWEKRKKQNNRR